MGLSYTWVTLALQGAGREEGAEARGASEAPAPPTLPGMLLLLDGSRHQWFQDQRWYD
jgi:hypothetical protein